MGKIRLKDLSRIMRIPEQDLLFKLKSLGVRVEGDDEIDSELIQAILQGKRLPQPREVILRDAHDEGTPAPAPRPAPGAKPKPEPRPKPGLRPHRRSMIQRVEPKIRELEVAEGAPQPKPARPQTAAATPVATDEAVKGPEAPQEASQPAAPAAPQPQAAEPQAPEKPAEAKPVAEKPAAEKAQAAKTQAAKPQAAKPQAAKPQTAPSPAARKADKASPKSGATGAKPAAGRLQRPPAKDTRPGAAKPTGAVKKPDDKKEPPRGLRKRARIISTPDPNKPIPDLTPRSQPPRGRGRGRGRGASTSYGRQPIRPSEPVPQMKPASARGHRRAQRREELASQSPVDELQMKIDATGGSTVTVSQGLTVREFAEKLGVKSKDLIKALFSRGIMATINHTLDLETAQELGADLGIDVVEMSFEEEVQLQHEEAVADTAEREGRAPVVTVMGHVDHGKTTLLDSIRKTNVAGGEAGGITQGIGAYHVELENQRIVFLDTPGHEAFTMMRARGAKVTDLVILVVGADDGVMPQTIEAIDHAKGAEVPIVVAINKIDRPNANPDRVRKELSDNGVLVEEWGGDVVSVPVSALKGDGIPNLLEMVLLTADILELKAAPTLPARGVVLEARKDVGRGVVATVVIQDGTLHKSDVFVAGSTWGRVRTMTDDRGKRLKASGPATAVEITGFDDLPSAGDLLQVHSDEGKVREIAQNRQIEERQKELAPRAGRVSLENLFEALGREEIKELPVVIKADVHGSVEVLKDTMGKLSTEKVELNVIRAAVGAITTNDVLFASASNAIIVGFNVRPERNAAQLAEQEEIDIRLHTVIYELLDEIKLAMAGLLEPVIREVQRGTAEVREIFKVPKIGMVAGCHVIDGVIPRNAGARLLRDNVVIWEGKLASLRRFKDDASEVRQGFDCGIGLEGYQDVKPGDNIEAFIREEVAATL